VKVGDHVIARDAHNRLRRATVAAVPRTWQDGLHESWTTKGHFPKRWLRFEDSGRIVPWPIEDVFIDLKAARGAQLSASSYRHDHVRDSTP
jgi:hypothetical protein